MTHRAVPLSRIGSALQWSQLLRGSSSHTGEVVPARPAPRCRSPAGFCPDTTRTPVLGPGLSPCFPWQMRDSNPRRQRQLIYSQPPLAAWVICRGNSAGHHGPATTALIVREHVNSTEFRQDSDLVSIPGPSGLPRLPLTQANPGQSPVSPRGPSMVMPVTAGACTDSSPPVAERMG